MTKQFKYLGSIVGQDEGADVDIQSWLNRARNTFRMLNNVYSTVQHSTAQYTNQAQDLSQLCPVYPFVWVRMLANATK